MVGGWLWQRLKVDLNAVVKKLYRVMSYGLRFNFVKQILLNEVTINIIKLTPPPTLRPLPLLVRKC